MTGTWWPLHDGQQGERQLPYFGPSDAMPEYWTAESEVAGRRAPFGNLLTIVAGTELRLLQADGMWIGLEFDSPFWFEFEVLSGEAAGHHVIVDGDWSSEQQLPLGLVPRLESDIRGDAFVLGDSVVGSDTALGCEFRGANRAKSRHAHVSRLCWCEMECDGDAFVIDSWRPPGLFCRGHYAYWERWGASDPSTTALAARGPDGIWRRVRTHWRLADGLPTPPNAHRDG